MSSNNAPSPEFSSSSNPMARNGLWDLQSSEYLIFPPPLTPCHSEKRNLLSRDENDSEGMVLYRVLEKTIRVGWEPTKKKNGFLHYMGCESLEEKKLGSEMPPEKKQPKTPKRMINEKAGGDEPFRGVRTRAQAKRAEFRDSHRRGIRVWIGGAAAVTLPVPPHCHFGLGGVPITLPVPPHCYLGDQRLRGLTKDLGHPSPNQGSSQSLKDQASTKHRSKKTRLQQNITAKLIATMRGYI